MVSGFLGSGKTTLVRRLLCSAQAEGARVAFISNEVGELGVDRALLGGGEEAFVELSGGCVCCQLNDALYETLIRLREEIDPDRIVIETSGVAVPHDVQITFYQPPLRDWVSEEAVVVVVDAEQLSEGRDLEGTFTEQVESADLVVLHKVDLVPPEAIPDLKAELDARNPGVAVVAAERGDVDPRLLFAAPVARRAPEPHTHHHEEFDCHELSLPAGLDVDELERRVRAAGALRVKGFVAVGGVPHVVQGVGRRVEVVPAEGPVDPALLGRVVVIRRR